MDKFENIRNSREHWKRRKKSRKPQIWIYPGWPSEDDGENVIKTKDHVIGAIPMKGSSE